MIADDLVAVVLWTGVTLYAIFGGADFGAGFWDLVAGGAARGARPRALIDHAIGPVWEANHTWLIFDLVILWTAFPKAFASIMSTLWIPLTLAALGIVLRGAGFAFRRVVIRLSDRRLFGATFALSSVLTPFFLGAAIGGIASGRVPPAGQGDLIGSWINPTSLLTGTLAVATGAYLAAVFLVSDARRGGDENLQSYFRRRAVGSAVAAGVLAVGGLFVVRADAPALFHGLMAEGLPLVAASILCGLVTLLLLLRGSSKVTRLLAVSAVASIIWAWGAAQYPHLLPDGLTIEAAAGAPATMTTLLVVFVAAALIVGPSLSWLYWLDQRSRLDA